MWSDKLTPSLFKHLIKCVSNECEREASYKVNPPYIGSSLYSDMTCMLACKLSMMTRFEVPTDQHSDDIKQLLLSPTIIAKMFLNLNPSRGADRAPAYLSDMIPNWRELSCAH